MRFNLGQKIIDKFRGKYKTDKIAVINEGELVELGNHEKLMKIENGQYRNLYEMQFRKQESIA